MYQVKFTDAICYVIYALRQRMIFFQISVAWKLEFPNKMSMNKGGGEDLKCSYNFTCSDKHAITA